MERSLGFLIRAAVANLLASGGILPLWHDPVMTFLQPSFEANGTLFSEQTVGIVLNYFSHNSWADLDIRAIASSLLTAFHVTQDPATQE